MTSLTKCLILFFVGCDKPISGRCITAMFRKFHPEHFVCSFCLKQLNKGTFKEQGEKPYCHECYDRLFGWSTHSKTITNLVLHAVYTLECTVMFYIVEGPFINDVTERGWGIARAHMFNRRKGGCLKIPRFVWRHLLTAHNYIDRLQVQPFTLNYLN